MTYGGLFPLAGETSHYEISETLYGDAGVHSAPAEADVNGAQLLGGDEFAYMASTASEEVSGVFDAKDRLALEIEQREREVLLDWRVLRHLGGSPFFFLLLLL